MIEYILVKICYRCNLNRQNRFRSIHALPLICIFSPFTSTLVMRLAPSDCWYQSMISLLQMMKFKYTSTHNVTTFCKILSVAFKCITLLFGCQTYSSHVHQYVQLCTVWRSQHNVHLMPSSSSFWKRIKISLVVLAWAASRQ